MAIITIRGAAAAAGVAESSVSRILSGVPGFAEPRKLRIGILGAGTRGINCFGRLLADHPGAEITAMADNNPRRMEAAVQSLAIGPRLYPSAKEMVTAEELDGLVITLPDYLHAEAVITALKSGVRSVLVDKPLATTTADCLAVIETMRATSGKVIIGFNARHRPLITRVKQLIDEGLIGKLMMIENREFYDGGRTYMGRWNRKYAWSGGLWVHKGTHDFDIFNWWNAGANPVRVTASAGLNAFRPDKIPFAVDPNKPVGPTCAECAYADICPDKSSDLPAEELFTATTQLVDGYSRDLCPFLSDKDVHDNGIALVEYDNNVRASHMECFACGFTTRMFTVVGDKGVLMADLLRPLEIDFRPRWGGPVTISVPPVASAHHGGADPILVDNWLRDLRGEQSNLSSIRDGLVAVAIGQAAEIASRERRSVDIDELVDLGRLADL